MVELIPQYKLQSAWAFNPRVGHLFLRTSLPFWRSRDGEYVHRVRSGTIHLWDGKPTHTTFTLWCGQVGQSKRGRLLAETGDGDVVCATCDGRATGAGQLQTHRINGRFVRFSPRLS